MRYRLNKEHIQGMLQHIGLAMFIGSLFYGIVEEGNLKIAISFAIIGVISALLGSLDRTDG